MHDSRIITVTIHRPYAIVYDFVSQPANFLLWASGLEHLQHLGEDWIIQTPQGRMRLRFTAPNPFGIVDHTIVGETGSEIYVPMRVIANGAGADIQFTLFRLSAMSDEIFARDIEWVEKDLQTLKNLLEDTPA